jgi:branched-chain amino acid transport system permease protein
MNRRSGAALLGGLAVVATWPIWGGQSGQFRSIGTITLIFMLAGIAWNIISGFGGQVSFGQGIFFGIGAYTTALLHIKGHVNTYLAVLIAIIIAVGVSVILGGLTLRLSGLYFSLATFALTLTLEQVATYTVGLTGGSAGVSEPFLGERPSELQFANQLWFFYIALLAAAVALGFSALLYRSRLGFSLRALRDDEGAARASGVRPFRTKMVALGISAAMTAIAGAIYVQFVGFIDPSTAFGETTAIQIALFTFVGGVGTVWGPVIGTGIFMPLQQYVSTSGSTRPGTSLMIYGLIVLIIIWLEPRGLIQIWRRANRYVRTYLFKGVVPDQISPTALINDVSHVERAVSNVSPGPMNPQDK